MVPLVQGPLWPRCDLNEEELVQYQFINTTKLISLIIVLVAAAYSFLPFFPDLC